jgi:hypothetical protein
MYLSLVILCDVTKCLSSLAQSDAMDELLITVIIYAGILMYKTYAEMIMTYGNRCK